MKHLVLTFLIGGSVLAVGSPAGAKSQDTQVLAPINQFVDGINKGDTKSAAAAYTPNASIIDEFGAHHWEGANAFNDWNNGFMADMKNTGVTEPWMKLLKPKLVRVNGDHAYVVQAGVFTFKQNGTKQSENGLFTYALDKTDSGWKLASWAWAVMP
jgi:ketosteroid isomerase-like protein